MINVGEFVLGYIALWGLFFAVVAIGNLLDRFGWILLVATSPVAVWLAAETEPLLFAIPITIGILIFALLWHDGFFSRR